MSLPDCYANTLSTCARSGITAILNYARMESLRWI